MSTSAYIGANNITILGSRWFSDCGIVRVKFGDEVWARYYIRGTDPNNSNSQAEDEAYIVSWGSKFPTAAGDALFGIKS